MTLSICCVSRAALGPGGTAVNTPGHVPALLELVCQWERWVTHTDKHVTREVVLRSRTMLKGVQRSLRGLREEAVQAFGRRVVQRETGNKCKGPVVGPALGRLRDSRRPVLLEQGPREGGCEVWGVLGGIHDRGPHQCLMATKLSLQSPRLSFPGPCAVSLPVWGVHPLAWKACQLPSQTSLLDPLLPRAPCL